MRFTSEKREHSGGIRRLIVLSAGLLLYAWSPGADKPADAEPLKGHLEATRVPVEDAAFRRPLTGTMEFAKSVDAVPAKLKPHRLFAESDLPAEGTEEGWYQIPRWRSGKFHRETQTDHTLDGDVTIVSKVDHVYGMQRDRHGGIWHHESWPKVTKISLDGYTEFKIIQSFEPIQITGNEYCVKVCSTDIDVDPATEKIMRVTKQQEFDRYVPGDNDAAKGEAIWQGFSMNGGPNTTVEYSDVEESKTDPFKPINSFNGKNLHKSFIAFLKSHGMSDEIPEIDLQSRDDESVDTTSPSTSPSPSTSTSPSPSTSPSTSTNPSTSHKMKKF